MWRLAGIWLTRMQGLTDMYLQGRIFNAEMCWQGRIFNAGFAGFCAGFRRDERGFANRDVLTGTHF